jgi:molybdate transport system substrate-binding protein
MNRPSHVFTRVAFVALALLALPRMSFAQVKVITSGGFRAVYQELLPEFERATGITVTTSSGQSQGTVPNAIGNQLRRGVLADVVILSKEGLDDLVAEGRILAGTNRDLAKTPLGVAVRAGAPDAAIGTVDAFKRTLLQAKAITFPSSTTGIYLATSVFPKLGIADAMRVKTTHDGAVAVERGDAELTIQPVSELLHASGVHFVGPLPEELQYISVFSAAVVAGSKETEGAKRLIAFLSSEGAVAAMKNNGMEPSRSR